MKLNQSVQRASAILRAAAGRPDGGTASGLARASGLPTSTALRLIHTLESEGFLARRRDGRYTIGLGLARLARQADGGDLVDATARAALDLLAAETGETVTLSVVHAHEALEVVLQVDAPHTVRAVSWVGRHYPLHASSSGKVLLAALEPARLKRFLRGSLDRPTSTTITDRVALRGEIERVRSQGYAVIVDELEEGLASVSVPITDIGGELAATVNVTGPSFRFDAERRMAALNHMRTAASRIAERLAE